MNWRQAINWTNVNLLSIGRLQTEFNENSIKTQPVIFIQGNAFEIVVCNVAAILRWPERAKHLQSSYTAV